MPLRFLSAGTAILAITAAAPHAFAASPVCEDARGAIERFLDDGKAQVRPATKKALRSIHETLARENLSDATCSSIRLSANEVVAMEERYRDRRAKYAAEDARLNVDWERMALNNDQPATVEDGQAKDDDAKSDTERAAATEGGSPAAIDQGSSGMKEERRQAASGSVEGDEASPSRSDQRDDDAGSQSATRAPAEADADEDVDRGGSEMTESASEDKLRKTLKGSTSEEEDGTQVTTFPSSGDEQAGNAQAVGGDNPTLGEGSQVGNPSDAAIRASNPAAAGAPPSDPDEEIASVEPQIGAADTERSFDGSNDANTEPSGGKQMARAPEGGDPKAEEAVEAYKEEKAEAEQALAQSKQAEQKGEDDAQPKLAEGATENQLDRLFNDDEEKAGGSAGPDVAVKAPSESIDSEGPATADSQEALRANAATDGKITSLLMDDAKVRETTVADLEGRTVFDSNGAEIGEVAGVMTKDGEPHLIVASGGFLGMGETEFPLAASAIEVRDGEITIPSMSDEEKDRLGEWDEAAFEEVDGEATLGSLMD